MDQARSIGIPAVTQTVVEPKWRALRTIAFLLKTLAWLIFSSSIVAATLEILTGIRVPLVSGMPFITNGTAPLISSVIVAVITIMGALLIFLGLFATAELIMLLIMIERNTRYR